MILTEDEVIERVDEYTLYSFYTEIPELIINSKYSSPLREGDLRPSFGVFERKYGKSIFQFLWKDNRLPAPNFGDIFYLVQRLYMFETRFEAVLKVCADFGFTESFDASKVLKKVMKVKEPSNIRIKSKPFSAANIAYWNQFNISKQILDRFNVTNVDYYFLYDSQEVPFMSGVPTYAYRIFDKYQIYKPKPKYFMTNWDALCIPGLAQLQRTDLLILTKSYKDIMFLSSLGFDAMAPKAENHIPQKEFIQYCSNRYARVVTLFDNDGKTSEHLYPFEHLQIPLDTGVKDPTDHCARYGTEPTFKLLNKLIYGNT